MKKTKIFQPKDYKEMGIQGSLFLSGHEEWLTGSTPENAPLTEEGWHVLNGVRLRMLPENLILKERAKYIGFLSPLISRMLGFEKPAVIKFSKVKNGITEEDGIVQGEWDSINNRIIEYPGRDLTREVQEKAKEMDVDLHYREEPRIDEGERITEDKPPISG